MESIDRLQEILREVKFQPLNLCDLWFLIENDQGFIYGRVENLIPDQPGFYICNAWTTACQDGDRFLIVSFKDLCDRAVFYGCKDSIYEHLKSKGFIKPEKHNEESKKPDFVDRLLDGFGKQLGISKGDFLLKLIKDYGPVVKKDLEGLLKTAEEQDQSNIQPQSTPTQNAN